MDEQDISFLRKAIELAEQISLGGGLEAVEEKARKLYLEDYSVASLHKELENIYKSI